MLFDRQRLLLSLLNTLDEPVSAMDFQNFLFLYTHELESSPSYEFVPYKLGGFSFTSDADKRKLIEGDYIVDDGQHWVLTDTGRDVARKQAAGWASLASFRAKYAALSGNPLAAEVYGRFPYYAARSEILDQVITDQVIKKRIEAERTAPIEPGLLTIGYEGKTLEGYLNQSLRAGVSLLCDVRRNSLSRKYGFSKKTLSHACQGVGIRYEHLPELGIASAMRKNLKSREDFDRLFAVYEAEILPQQTSAVGKIRQWIKEDKQRVALTCYERDPGQCHRLRVARAVEPGLGKKHKTEHL